ncbi:MAG: Fe-S cluster assembly protein SufD [Planctomycetota bacterium]
MTTVTREIMTFTSEGFESFLATRNEPEWLTEQRRQAWDRFIELGWPTRKDEEWMRTDIRQFKLEEFEIGGIRAQIGSPNLLSEGVDVAGSVSFSGGVATVQKDLDSNWIDKGVVFGPLNELVHTHGDLIEKYLNRLVDPNIDRFSALHAATWANGYFLYVPRNVVLEQPIHTSNIMGDGGSDFGHTLIVLEDGAEATVLAESSSDSSESGGLHCGAVEIYVGDRANLRYVNLQDWSQNVWHFAHQKATVGQDSNLQWTVGALGSKLAKVNQHVDLTGEGGNTQVNGVMFTENEQHLSYHTQQRHCDPNCVSDFLYKAALQDHSRTVWRGMIKVDKDAQKTDGFQRNDNLLLSTKARADSIPGLEIEADDVRCTHGSTSGRVDEELIFYAMARGFTRKEAVRAIVVGFFQQVFDRVTIESVREALGVAIARRVRDYE